MLIHGVVKISFISKEFIMVLSPSTYRIIRDSLKLRLNDITEEETQAFIKHYMGHSGKKQYHNRLSTLRKRKQKIVNAIINVKALQKFYD
jgi:uncharacterized FlgJ-related protein